MNIFEKESQDINGLKSWIIRFFSVKIPFILILIVTRPWINDVSHRTYVYRNTKTCKVIFNRKHQLWITYMRCKLHMWVIYMRWNNHIYDLKKLRCRTVNWQYSRGYNRIFFIYFTYHSFVQIYLKFCTRIKGWADTNNGQFLETTYNTVVSVDVVLPFSRTLHLFA